jgi:hypothetical protein
MIGQAVLSCSECLMPSCGLDRTELVEQIADWVVDVWWDHEYETDIDVDAELAELWPPPIQHFAAATLVCPVEALDDLDLRQVEMVHLTEADCDWLSAEHGVECLPEGGPIWWETAYTDIPAWFKRDRRVVWWRSDCLCGNFRPPDLVEHALVRPRTVDERLALRRRVAAFRRRCTS